MISGFALYQERGLLPNECTVALPIGARAQRIERLPHGWRVWTSTRDFRYGSYLELFDDGRILNCTTRADEGDEYFWARPSDQEIRSGKGIYRGGTSNS
jgi:hypothetical protein